MLLNDFFTIKAIQHDTKYTVQIDLNPSHKIYNGHFPGNPITPGVCMTQMVQETIEHITNKKLQLVKGSNIKFTAILNPEVNSSVTMNLNIIPGEGHLVQADSSLFADSTNFYSFKGSFKEIEAI